MTERLFLRAPEQGKIDPAGETDHGEFGRLAAFDDRLDDPRRQKSEPQQPPHRAAIESFPPRYLARPTAPGPQISS